MSRRIRRLAAASLLTLSMTGCAVTVDSMPLPKPGVGGPTYRVRAIFDNALNLPERARVKIGGSDIGIVTHIDTANFLATVELEIREDIPLPRDVRAELRQPTPLGDIYVAVTLPQQRAGTPLLHDGDVIDREHTSAGASVEQLMMSLSMLLNGGALEQVARITSDADSMVAGRGPQLSHLITEITATLTALNQRTDQLDSVLHGMDALGTTLNQRKAELGQAADSFPPLISIITENNRAITDLTAKVTGTLGALGDFTATSSAETVSLFHSVQQLMDGFSAMGDNLAGALDRLHALQPSVLASTKGTNLAVAATVSYLSIGALTDPNGSRLPDGTDPGAFLGSLADVLTRVINRLQGGAR
ncbi:MCE family protein [Nocardia sp. NPDC056000]|uniref:MCE family protein n=1 Tax=Nocardia sp. NPDC056000 TaxID=3345674 RepID=UPI0035D708D2